VPREARNPVMAISDGFVCYGDSVLLADEDAGGKCPLSLQTRRACEMHHRVADRGTLSKHRVSHNVWFQVIFVDLIHTFDGFESLFWTSHEPE
jgi:hypothetical protein